MLLHHLLKEGAERAPDRTALGWVKRDRSLNFAEAAEATDRVAAGLALLGVERGDRVGVFAHSGLDYLLAMFGAWRAGAAAALVDLSRAGELDRYFGDCRPKVVIYTHDYFETIDRHRETLDSVETYVCLDGAQPGAMDWAEILGCTAAPPAHVVDSSDIAHLSYAPATTGEPMGSCLSHEPTCGNARSLAERLGIGPDDVSLGPTPLSGANQLAVNLLPVLSATGTCWVMNNWEAEGGLDVADRLGATILAADAPVLAAALSEAGSRDGGPPASLRLVLAGEGVLPADLQRAWGAESGVAPAEVRMPEASEWPPPGQ
ncbi:MAG: class I adenylate-forming enzyme family protein [bacterium]|nr:class I adenylate-forming enzyme family protein [bacterium]